jgi:hypothetical protein
MVVFLWSQGVNQNIWAGCGYMQIFFMDELIQSKANSLQLLVDHYGQKKAMKIRQRLDELGAADNLYHLNKLPAAKCLCVSEDLNLLSVNTIDPSNITFGIHEDFPPGYAIEISNWHEIKLIRIMSLDGEI